MRHQDSANMVDAGQETSTRRTTRPHSPARRLECSAKPVAREMHAIPRIQPRKLVIPILVPSPRGVQAGDGRPAREFPLIKGLANLEIAVHALTGWGLRP